MGFSTVLSRTCDSALASRWQILLDFYEDETGTFPNSYLVPYTSLQDGSLACNGAFLGQNRSRTSLQDRDPACKRNLWDALRCKIGIPRAKLFESNVRHPWKGSGPLLTKNLTGRRLRHSCQSSSLLFYLNHTHYVASSKTRVQVRLFCSGPLRLTSLGHETVTPDEQCWVPITKARSEGVTLSVLESDLAILPNPFN